jgi:sigma-B regulation protein RsbU (phosphoserine phosphatase)
LAPLKEPPYTYRLSLISDHGDVYSNSPEDIPLSHVHVFSFSGTWNGILKQLEQFKKEIGILEFLHNRYHRIGLKMPVPNSDFSLVVDVSEKAIFEVSSDNVLLGLSSLLLMILVLGGVGTVLVTRRIARPLKALNHEMEKIGEGDLNAHYIKDPMGFEINVLGHNFNCMIASLKQHIEEAKNERVRSETLAQELKIGHEIQKTIFPKRVPELPGLDIGAGFLSAKEVAGDFYDLFVKKENGQLMMAIADAAGKGISACLYALEVRSMLRSFESSYNDLSKTVDSTNDLFCLDTGDTGVFVTAWVGVYDPDSRKLNYSSCGHPPAILRRRDGRLEELGTHGMALGVEPFHEVQARTIQLVTGDIVILYTDGITEAHNPENELFGKQRLMDIIDKNANRSAQELVHKIFEEVASFAQEAAQHDDLTLLIARVRD